MIPHLVNARTVTYRRLLDDTPGRDGYAVHQYADGVELEAQVNWISREARARLAQFGEAVDSSCKLVFRTADLEDAGVTVNRGDRFTVPSSILGTSELTVVEVRPVSPLMDTFLLTEVYLREEKHL